MDDGSRITAPCHVSHSCDPFHGAVIFQNINPV